MIKLENISVNFEGTQILNNVNIHISKGEKVCFSGISGRGKTTLLKLIQGHISQYEGTVSINGTELTSTSAKQIRDYVSWLPQNINLPVNNGAELITLLNNDNKTSEIEKWLQKLGLEPAILLKNFKKVSGGQKQRIITAICIALNKPVLIMDEPTSSLDDESIHLLINVVNSLSDTTIISASHNKLWVNNSEKVIEL